MKLKSAIISLIKLCEFSSGKAVDMVQSLVNLQKLSNFMILCCRCTTDAFLKIDRDKSFIKRIKFLFQRLERKQFLWNDDKSN